MYDITDRLTLSHISRRDYDSWACSYSVLWEHVLETGLLEDLEKGMHNKMDVRNCENWIWMDLAHYHIQRRASNLRILKFRVYLHIYLNTFQGRMFLYFF
jgi:hypothetical protein